MSKIRWGLVSAGRIAHTFTQDMAFVGNGEITAVAARSIDSANVFADQYKIEKRYQGYQALFEDPEIDAVYISTPHAMHYEHTKMALSAGKHVLCEKPFTVDVAQCEELVILAKQQNCFLMEAMWTLFLPAIRKAQQWIDEGRIGDIVQIQSDFGYPLPYDPDRREWDVRLGGGCLLEMGVYPVAFNWLFTQREPSCIQAEVKRAPNGADSHVAAVFDYGDQISMIGASFKTRLRNWGYVFGTDGYIAIPDYFRASDALLYVRDDCVDHFSDPRVGSGFEFQTIAAGEAILAGKVETDIMPHKHSIAFQRHMQAIFDAAKN
jgi:predicted dehydrogenase